jgi:hypothetical protein
MSSSDPNKDKKKSKFDIELKKIRKIYENYGIDTSDMSEEELDRIYHQYKKTNRSIENDVRESERYSAVFDEDDIIG